SSFAVVLFNNTSGMDDHTNRTVTERYLQLITEFYSFVDQLNLADLKIILIFVAICTILGNTLVFVEIWRERSLHQPNKYFIACLAVADLLTGSIVAPLRAYRGSLDVESRRTMSIDLCRFMVWIDTFA
ncbi:Dopamine receptor 2, partial [Paramuricea clavata]